MAISCWISGEGLSGFNGTTTAPEAQHGKVRLDEVDAVAAQQRDPITGAHAERGEASANPGDLVAELAVGRLDTRRDDRDVIGRLPVDDVCEIHRDCVLQTKQRDHAGHQDEDEQEGQA